MKILFSGLVLVALIFTIIVMILKPEFRPTIELLVSIYLITQFVFIVCRGIYRTIRNRLQTDKNTSVGTSWFSDLLLRVGYSLLSVSIFGLPKRQKSLSYPTVVSLLMRQRTKANSIAYMLLSSAVVIYLVFSFVFGVEPKTGTILFIVFLMLSLNINWKVSDYRIKHGFYGTNEYEAREILNFITSHADKSSFTTGKGLKDVLSAPMEEAHDHDIIPGAKGFKA
jgi:hypothetical protein